MAPGLWGTGLVVVAHGLSCSMASGILPNRALNLCFLHWQADFFFFTTEPPGKPGLEFNSFIEQLTYLRSIFKRYS